VSILEEGHMQSTSPAPETITKLPVLMPRPADSNKGSFGKVLVIAGSRGMSGAAILAGSSALRGGAGLVRVAVPSGILPIVASANPCYLTAGFSEDDHGRFAEGAETELGALARANDVVALGPGLGQSEGLTKLVSALLDKVEVPVVLDADGLNAIQHCTSLLKRRKAPTIITPHPGEFARLIGSTVAEVQARRQDLAVRFAAELGVVLVLKGNGSIVTDGRKVYHNSTGNPGMATGGTGDVLTGLIAALIGQKLEPFAAAQLGTHLHGLAGDLARDDLHEVCLIASDLLNYLAPAFRNF